MKNAAILFLAICISVPIAAPCVAFVVKPWRERREAEWLRVSSLSSLPREGTPCMIAVRMARRDAWARFPEETVGTVFLRRAPETGNVIALSSIHWPGGSCVEYDDTHRRFRSTCWRVEFDVDGQMLVPDEHSGLAESMPQIPAKSEGGDVHILWVAP